MPDTPCPLPSKDCKALPALESLAARLQAVEARQYQTSEAVRAMTATTADMERRLVNLRDDFTAHARDSLGHSEASPEVAANLDEAEAANAAKAGAAAGEELAAIARAIPLPYSVLVGPDGARAPLAEQVREMAGSLQTWANRATKAEDKIAALYFDLAAKKSANEELRKRAAESVPASHAAALRAEITEARRILAGADRLDELEGAAPLVILAQNTVAARDAARNEAAHWKLKAGDEDGPYAARLTVAIDERNAARAALVEAAAALTEAAGQGVRE